MGDLINKCTHPGDKQVLIPVYKETYEKSYILVVCSICGETINKIT